MVVFLTADNCGHCLHSRGDGIINNGKVLMQTKTLMQFLKHDIELINIHYKHMMATKNTTKNISKFYLSKGKVIQERYYEIDNTLRLDVYNQNSDKIFNDFVKKEGQKISWFQFLKDRIPNKLSNYLFYFPCFMVVERSNWAQTLTDSKEELIALTNAGITYKDKNGNVMLKRSQDSFQKRTVDIIKLLEDIVSGKEKLEPLEVEDQLPADKKRKIAKEIPLENFIEYKDVIIKSYDE